VGPTVTRWGQLTGLARDVSVIVPSLALALASTLIAGSMSGVTVLAVGAVADKRTLGPLVVWMAALATGEAMSQVRDLAAAHSAVSVRRILVKALLRHSAQLPYEDFERRSILLRLNRARELAEGNRVHNLLMSIVTLATQLVQIVAIGLAMVHLSVWLILAVLPVVLAQFWVEAMRSKDTFEFDVRTRGWMRFIDRLEALFKDRSVNAELRVFRSTPWLLGKWTGAVRSLHKAQMRQTYHFIRRDVGIQGITVLSYVGAFVYSVALVKSHTLSAGGLLAVLLGLQNVQGTAGDFSYSIGDTGNLLMYVRDAAALIGRQAQRPTGLDSVPTGGDYLVLRGVRYRYPGAHEDALSGVCLELRRGSVLALVGPNGAGKTTLGKVLLGLLPITAGEITGDRPGSGRRGAVFQDYNRFELTIRENVGLGRIENMWDDDRLRAALIDAGAQELSRDLETGVGSQFPGSIDLSGGQWQALAIGRGLFANGDVIVLDEPTASLDPLSEQAVFARFQSMTRGAFAVIITHRLGATSLADTVAVMEHGRIVEWGTRDELLQQRGIFAQMWEAQAQWYRDAD
jgi:ATP-binding cassette subfamily B protein